MMREEDLIRIAKKLDKMVSGNNTEGALDLLKELKSFNMTLKLLQETRIGMSVNGIRKHCTDDEVVALAKILIKDWKRLLDTESPSEIKNGVESSKTIGSPVHSPSERETSRRPEVETRTDSDPEKKTFDKQRKEKRDDEQKKDKQAAEQKQGRPTDEPQYDRHLHVAKMDKHPQETRKERQTEEHKKHLNLDEPRKQRPAEEPRKERHVQDHLNERHKHEPQKDFLGQLHEPKKERCPEEPRKESYTEEARRERHTEEHRKERPVCEPPKERPADNHRWVFERRSVLDGNILYPTRYPSPPRPQRLPPPLKRLPAEVKRERRDSADSLSSSRPPPRPPLKSSSPPPRRPSLEVKKDSCTPKKEKCCGFPLRKKPPDPNAPFAPLPLHLHPPPKPSALEVKKERKEPPDPNAPLPPLPFHLHPPPLVKRPSVDGKKERKEMSDSKPLSLKKTSDHVKRHRKDSSDSEVPKRPSVEAKKERKDSSDSKPRLPKKLSVDGKKDKDRKDSTDSKPVSPAKRHSSESKSDRKESTDFKKDGSPPSKKLSGEGRESHGSKPSHPGPLQRKPSTDSTERRVKPDTPKSPTTPTSPMSPSFSSAGGGPLSPRLATGDSIRDKCIEMLAAALRTDDNYKEFGTNCDAMASEMEDYIYQEIRATDMKYKNRVRSRISNLKDPKNPNLRRNVLAGGIELSRFATMTAEEMASDELKQLRNVMTQEAIREHQMAKTGGTSTDLLQCDKCRKKNCTYNQVQTRSADEPMTTFVLCNECGNRWKFC